jgi:hypothetical protein
MQKFKLSLKESYSSINLFEKIHLLEISTINNMSIGMDWVHQNNFNVVLVGGTAVVNYLNGGRDLTPDVDYLTNDLTKIKAKLTQDKIPFSDLKGYTGGLLGITVPKFNIDFLDSNVGNKSLNKLILGLKTTTNIGGVVVPIIVPELLAILKLDLGRTKDINDGFALLTSGKVNKKKYIDLVTGLKPTLSDYESLIGYSELIK